MHRLQLSIEAVWKCFDWLPSSTQLKSTRGLFFDRLKTLHSRIHPSPYPAEASSLRMSFTPAKSSTSLRTCLWVRVWVASTALCPARASRSFSFVENRKRNLTRRAKGTPRASDRRA